MNGVVDTEGVAKLREVRDLTRRLIVQFVVLVCTDIQRATYEITESEVVTEASIARKRGRTAAAAAIKSEGGGESWVEVARSSELFTPAEVDAYSAAGNHFVGLAARNLESALFPLFKARLFYQHLHHLLLHHLFLFICLFSARLSFLLIIFVNASPPHQSHFPHVNMYRECMTHVKGLARVWGACNVIAQTPIPFP